MLNANKPPSKLDLPIAVSSDITISKNQETFKDLENDRRFELQDDRAKLIILVDGSLTLMVDFKDIELKGPALLLISPEQACKVTFNQPDCLIYCINYSAALVIAELEKLTVDTFADNFVLKSNDKLCKQVKAICELMCSIDTEAKTVFVMQSLHGLLLTLMSLIAGASLNTQNEKITSTNPLVIGFRQLLKKDFRKLKKPADYAHELGITPAHLNDTIKLATGHSVSEQIQQQIVLETKRLLFFSELSMKEIGFEIGFDDPVYFNRLFKKLTGQTPLTFRETFRNRYHKYLHPFYQCTNKR